MNIYEQMSKNLYNPNAQSGEDIQKMLNMQSGYGQQGQQGQNTSNLDYALLANAITPFTSQQGGGQGSGGYMNPATSGMMGEIGSLGKQFAGNVGLFSPWNQSTTLGADSTVGFGGAPLNLMMSGQSDYTNKISPWIDTAGSIGSMFGLPTFPILNVVAGMLEGAIGKDPKGVYPYYDPKTRGWAQGYGYIEEPDMYSEAFDRWSAVKEGITNWIGNTYSSQYGLDPNNLMEQRYGQDMPSDLGLPIQSNQMGSYYKPESKAMIDDVLAKAGGYWGFFNPVESDIFKTYSKLFLEPANPDFGGPSPHGVFLGSMG